MPIATDPTEQEVERRIELVTQVAHALGRPSALSLEDATEKLAAALDLDRKEARTMVLQAAAVRMTPGVRLCGGIVEVSGASR